MEDYDKVAAVQAVRWVTGLGLKEAKDAVEHTEATRQFSHRDPHTLSPTALLAAITVYYYCRHV